MASEQVQGLHGLEHYELVNIGALQSSCELPGALPPAAVTAESAESADWSLDLRLGEVGCSNLWEDDWRLAFFLQIFGVSFLFG